MPASNYRIRTMTAPEVALAIDWAAAEGWNPGKHDAPCFRAADPDGFLIGLLDDKPVATISVVRYGSAFGFLGLYIVKPEHRGRGYGRTLWNAGIAFLGHRTIGLDGVVAQQANYRKSGFELAYRNVRYQGTAGRFAARDSRLISLASVDLAAVHDYDRTCFPANRTVFLDRWIGQPDGAALGLRRGDRLAGFGVIRAARTGQRIGPLFADDPEIAEALFRGLVAAFPSGTPFYLDVPEINRAAVELAERHGMTVVFETARMYAGRPPAPSIERVFGVTTFELG
jgi:ribosomal protein S18 acetylase RimI-like enzyme